MKCGPSRTWHLCLIARAFPYYTDTRYRLGNVALLESCCRCCWSRQGLDLKRMWVVVRGKKVGNLDWLHRSLILAPTSNSDAALPNVPSDPPHGYGFGKGTDSHTHTRTPAYPSPVPARVSIPVSFTNGTGLLALGSVELEVVGFSGYSGQAPLARHIRVGY